MSPAAISAFSRPITHPRPPPVGYATTINSAMKATKETKETKVNKKEGVEKRHENRNLEMFPPVEQPFPDP